MVGREGKILISKGYGLPTGQVTYLWKRADGVCWAVFFNQRIDSGPRDGAIVAPINKALDASEITGPRGCSTPRTGS